MARPLRLLWALALLLPSLARAEPQIVTSRAVSDVAVTVYRDPYRTGAMSANWPGGYALITETRTVSIPAGDSQVRFEDVAEGLLPETAIVTGLPGGVWEKNRDARLISPAGLVDAYLKRRVLVRRTDPATGKVRQSTAIVQAGPDGGVVLQTADGVEALRCSGLPERILYDGVPASLTARPTLSILTRAARATTATIRLTYMAQGFDWSANYVGRLAPGGDRAALFAWLTVANGGRQSFRDARLQVIAGKPNKRENVPPPPPPSAWLDLQCWPVDVTSTHPKQAFTRLPLPQGPDLAAFNRIGSNAPGSFETRKQRRAREKAERAALYDDSVGQDIVVTGSRVGGSSRRERIQFAAMAPPPPPPPPAPPPPPPAPMAEMAVAEGAQAKVEALGDLKLYRVPMRVTVAAQAQKQVAMLVQPDVAFERVYLLDLGGGGGGGGASADTAQPVPFELRVRNTDKAGLGVPLPAGTVALFARGAGRDLYAGEAPIDDRAVGEEFGLRFGDSPDVSWTIRRTAGLKDRDRWQVEISNARAAPVRVEVILPFQIEDRPADATRVERGWLLPVDVAANAAGSVGYTMKR